MVGAPVKLLAGHAPESIKRYASETHSEHPRMAR